MDLKDLLVWNGDWGAK